MTNKRIDLYVYSSPYDAEEHNEIFSCTIQQKFFLYAVNNEDNKDNFSWIPGYDRAFDVGIDNEQLDGSYYDDLYDLDDIAVAHINGCRYANYCRIDYYRPTSSSYKVYVNYFDDNDNIHITRRKENATKPEIHIEGGKYKKLELKEFIQKFYNFNIVEEANCLEFIIHDNEDEVIINNKGVDIEFDDHLGNKYNLIIGVDRLLDTLDKFKNNYIIKIKHGPQIEPESKYNVPEHKIISWIPNWNSNERCYFVSIVPRSRFRDDEHNFAILLSFINDTLVSIYLNLDDNNIHKISFKNANLEGMQSLKTLINIEIEKAVFIYGNLVQLIDLQRAYYYSENDTPIMDEILLDIK